MTKQQVVAIHELDEDVIVCELTGNAHNEALDVWVAEDGNLGTDHHRSVLIDDGGNVLGDEVVPDSD